MGRARVGLARARAGVRRAMDLATTPKPYEFIGFGAMDATKPYEFIGSIHVAAICQRGPGVALQVKGPVGVDLVTGWGPSSPKPVPNRPQATSTGRRTTSNPTGAGSGFAGKWFCPPA